MTVSVNLLGLHRELVQTDRILIPIENKMCVADVFNYIQEKYPDLSLDEEMVLVTVNRHLSSLDQALKADDEISFIPHIGGG
jgi:molybdopterin converting factor small subunit